jgi:ferredoxin
MDRRRATEGVWIGDAMNVWIDQDLCTGDGLCTDHCAEVFVLLEDGISYVRDAATGVVDLDPGGRASMVPVPRRYVEAVIDAAEACPGECIFVEVDRLVPADGTGGADGRGHTGAPAGEVPVSARGTPRSRATAGS